MDRKPHRTFNDAGLDCHILVIVNNGCRQTADGGRGDGGSLSAGSDPTGARQRAAGSGGGGAAGAAEQINH